MFRRRGPALLFGRDRRDRLPRDAGLIRVAMSPGRATIVAFATGIADPVRVFQGPRMFSHLESLLVTER
jgi:hypothetical protein